MNGSANPHWEPFVSALPREAQVSRFPLAPALNVLLTASVVLVAVTLVSQIAPRDLQLYRDSLRLYRDNSIVLTAAKAIPQAESQPVVKPVARTRPQASLLNRTQPHPGVTLASPIALSPSTLASAPPPMADRPITQNSASITEWPSTPLGLQAPENASRPDVPLGAVDRPVMTIAGPTQWPSNGGPASCRWPACQLPTIAPASLQDTRAFMPLPPQLSDPWTFSFASRLANQYPEVWELVVVRSLAAWAPTLDFGAMRLTAAPHQWLLSTQTRNGLNFYAGNLVTTPLQWFGVGATPGVGMRTPGGLDIIVGSAGVQVFQPVKTPLGPLFGGITPYGPMLGGAFTSGNFSGYIGTMLMDGQPKVAGAIAFQHGNLSLAYVDTTTDRGIGMRFARGALDLSVGMFSSDTTVSLTYTPPAGPMLLAYWSMKSGLNFLAVGSLSFGNGNPSPPRVREYTAPGPLSAPGVASNQ